MQIYKVYEGEVLTVPVTKVTKCFYWFKDCQGAFGWATRIEKERACLTPQEAIQEALNRQRITRGVLRNKLIKVENEVVQLEKLEKKHQEFKESK